MEFATLIINPIVKTLMVPVKKHLGFLVSSTSYVEDMDARMKQLIDTQKDMQKKKDAADAVNQVVPEHVSRWLEDAIELNENAASINPTTGIGCFNVTKRYKAGKQSSYILKKIDDLETRKSKIEWTDELIPLAMVSSTSTWPSTSASVHGGTQKCFESRDKIFNDALKSLHPDNETHNMIALCGMGGVGKTTMMEQLKKSVEHSKMFDWIVKVVIGENTDPIAFQQAIAEKMGGALTETSKDARADRLRSRFMGMAKDGKKKILVIMDDLWNEVDLNDVGLMSPLPNGLKMLFTSRFEYVCTKMGVKTDSIFKVGVLNVTEANKLFFEIVGPSISDSDYQEFQKIGENIVEKCGGLPIAIKTIANNLRGNIKEAWEVVLYRLEDCDLKDLDGIVKKIFEMSYDKLEEDVDKSIFLLCGLFPDDYDIPTEELLRYAWGLDLFKRVKTLAIARRDMKICINKLIRANLLTESDELGCVKMHDLVRAFVLSNFTKLKQASIDKHNNMVQRTKDSNESYERILLKCTGMSEFLPDFNYPNLLLLMLMDGDEKLEFPGDFYGRMKKLQVVSYEDMSVPLLPVTFESAANLRTLCLRSCSLMDDISFLGRLINLETLSFADCNIEKLPSPIGKLKNLKLLDLTGCVDLCIDDGVFENLVRLEEIYMITSKGKPIRFTAANCDEMETLSQRLFALEMEFFQNKARPENVSFTKLERFRISIGCELEFDDTYLCRNTLQLKADCNELLECKINELFKITEELFLQVNNMNHLEDVSVHPSQDSFSNLRFLNIFKCEDLTYLFTVSVACGLKKLEQLTVSECPVLKVLVGGHSGYGVIKFQKLQYMCLKDLPNLLSLCDSGNVIELTELEELILNGLPNFNSIYPDNTNTSSIQSFLTTEVVVPKLEILDISIMENLKQIWPCEITSTEKDNVSMLQEIKVSKCDSLVNLFPCNPLPLLNQLERLELSYCDSVDMLFKIDLECVCEMEEGSSSSSRLRNIILYNVSNLRVLWRIEGLNNSDILINGFKGVESINMTDCYMFKHLFTPTTANFDLGALTAYVRDCNTLYLNEKEAENKLVEGSQEITLGIFKGESSDNITHTSHLMRTCHHLQYFILSNDKSVDVVFEMDSPSSRTDLATIQQPLPLHYLENLNLLLLIEMRHVWKCNWNKFLLSHQQPTLKLPFHNLANIYLCHCTKLNYLFSPLMARFLYNLKSVKIENCFGIEEVISSRDDDYDENATSTTSHINTTLFPHFDTLYLSSLSRLKRIDGAYYTASNDQSQGARVPSALWSLCQYPREIHVEFCHALSCLIPCYAAGQMKKLEQLTITSCRRMKEVFESQAINNDTNVDEGSACEPGGTATTLKSSRLKSISFVPQILSNLKVVSISRCYSLRHIFSFSTLESLKQLKMLSVSDSATRVIVKEEDEMASYIVVFPRLETLELVNLPKLEGFFLGMNDFRWPSLNHVMIKDCFKMKVFTSGQSKTPKLKHICTRLGKNSLECDLNFHDMTNQHEQTTFSSSYPTISKGLPLSFHNLIEIDVEIDDQMNDLDIDYKKIIPSHGLLQLQKLEKIRLKFCNLVEEVFDVSLEGSQGTNSRFNESQNVVTIPKLKELCLNDLNGLKYIWKSNPWMTLEFPKLTSVTIQYCQSLEYVFTSSMVGCLMQLKHLHINKCTNMKVIVKGEEKESDAKVKEIVLPRLESLRLEELPSLEGFYLGMEAFSWPSLITLEIKECHVMTFFTKEHLATPKLKVMDTKFGKCIINEELNSFITTKQEKGAFGIWKGAIWDLSLSKWLFDAEK